MKKRTVLLAAFLLSQSASAGSELVERYKSLQKNYSTCSKEAPAEGLTGDDCAYSLDEQADQLLNDLYRQIMGRKTKAEQLALRQDQRAWIVKRDAIVKDYAAQTEGMFKGRSKGAATYHTTMDRIAELQKNNP